MSATFHVPHHVWHYGFTCTLNDQEDSCNQGTHWSGPLSFESQ
jgi:hypothetical protein